MTYTPIAVFAYNIPRHLQRTLNALKSNREASLSELFIFLDGAKEHNLEQVKEVEQIARSIEGFAKITVIKQQKNIGLAQNVISGISHVLTEFETVIVLEDDLMPSPFFLQYMNDGLKIYHHDKKVASIHAYVHPLKPPLPQTSFLKYPNSWGWATWRRAWVIFEEDGTKLLAQLQNQKLTKEFDFNGNYRFTRMLQRQIEGKNNSWAIRWYASVFLNDMLCLYPENSLIKDFGNDGSGENCFNDSIFDVDLRLTPLIVNRIIIEDNKIIRKKYETYFYSIDSLKSRIKIKFKRYLRKYEK